MFDFLKKKSQEEIFIDKLPVHPDIKKEVRFAFHRATKDEYDLETQEGIQQKQSDLKIIRDASHIGLSTTIPDNSNKKSYIMISGREQIGYAPTGSVLRKLYPNDFQLHAFLAEAWYASVKSRKELWVEANRDGYVLESSGSVSKRDIKLINQTLIDLRVPYYRNKLRDNLAITGNCLLQNKKNKFGGLLELNPLVIEKVAPRYDPNFDTLMGWDYTLGNRKLFIPYDMADHIATYNARSNILGAPACNSIIPDIEAALQAAIYNNNLMQRGGLLKALIRLKTPEGAGWTNDKVSLNLADEFSKWLDKRFGGIRGSGQLAFVPWVEGIDVLNRVSEMDAAWVNLDEKTASKTALLYGLYPEKIGIARSSQYLNKTLVTDTMALSFDNNNYYYMGLVDEYLTKVIIKEGLGIDNVAIRMSGDFSAVSKTAAEVGLLISQMNVDIMRVDEFRVDILHIDPLGGELGQKFLGEVLRQSMLSKSEGNLDRAIGQAKHFVGEYREFSKSNKVRHRWQEIPYY